VEVYFSLYVCFCVFCGLQLDAKNEKANELFSALAYRWDQYADVSQIIKLITSFSRTKIQFLFYSHKIGGSPWSNCSRWYLSERLLRGKFVARRGVVFEGKLSCSCRERFALRGNRFIGPLVVYVRPRCQQTGPQASVTKVSSVWRRLLLQARLSQAITK